jgi:hypothetical protein
MCIYIYIYIYIYIIFTKPVAISSQDFIPDWQPYLLPPVRTLARTMAPKRSNKRSAAADLQGVAEKVRRGVFESSVAEIQSELMKDPGMAAQVLHMIKGGLLKEKELDINKLHKSQNKICLIPVKHIKQWLEVLKPGVKELMRGCREKLSYYQLISFACHVETNSAVWTKCLDDLQVKVLLEAESAGQRLHTHWCLKDDMPDWSKMGVFTLKRKNESEAAEGMYDEILHIGGQVCPMPDYVSASMQGSSVLDN